MRSSGQDRHHLSAIKSSIEVKVRGRPEFSCCYYSSVVARRTAQQATSQIPAQFCCYRRAANQFSTCLRIINLLSTPPFSSRLPRLSLPVIKTASSSITCYSRRLRGYPQNSKGRSFSIQPPRPLAVQNTESHPFVSRYLGFDSISKYWAGELALAHSVSFNRTYR